MSTSRRNHWRISRQKRGIVHSGANSMFPKRRRARPFKVGIDPISIQLIVGLGPLSRPMACNEDRIMTAKTSFRGSFTALVTPFKNGSVDEKGFRALVDWQIAEGTNGLVPVGNTGESPTLSHEEHHEVVEWCVDQAKGRVPIVAGAGSNSTKEAVALARH